MRWGVLSRPWGPERLKWARSIALVIATGVVVSQGVRVFDPDGDDFRLHWTFGHLFVAGEFMYKIGHTPYPPFWGMVCAPLTLLPMRWAHVVAYQFGVATLGGLVVVLDRLTRRSLPLGKEPLFWSTALALALSSRFLIRELPECGPNLLMVALAWGGLALWRQRFDGLGGACLGLAIAMKCTQALFVPYFALKRQWRMAAVTTAFTALFTVAPVLRLGPTSYEHHLLTWIGNCWKGLREADPSIGVLGQEEVKNVSLRPTLARFLMHLPPGHKGRIASPWRAEWLNLPSPLAGVLIKAGMLLLLAGVAWGFRRPARDRDDDTILWEGAAVSLLILLYSPLTWKQHCVAVFPAFYLITRTGLARGGLPWWVLGALGVYVTLVLLPDRGVVGRSMTLLLDSWGVITWSLSLLLAVTLACRSRRVAAVGDASRGGAVPPPHFAGMRTPWPLRGAFLRRSRITGHRSSRWPWGATTR